MFSCASACDPTAGYLRSMGGAVRRNRLLLVLALGLAGGFLLLLRPRTPRSTSAVQRLPPPVAKRRQPPLQADAEGSYVPGYPFTVNGFRFTGFSLHPEALVTFAQTTVACVEAQISAQSVHLRCDDPQVGKVTIDGRFLTRLATSSLDTPVLSAVVTVRTASGEILYSARDSFRWQPGD